MVSIDEIKLGDIEFWGRAEPEREAAFRLLRDEAPISFHEEPVIEGFGQGPGFWALTRFDDVVHASRHAELFCSGRGGSNIGDIPSELGEFLGSIINMDDPRHARMRRLVSNGFTPKALNEVLDTVRAVARDVVADVTERGECDFVADIASQLPLRIVCDMVGLPAEERATVYDQSNIILGLGDAEFVNSIEDLMGAFLTLHQMAMELGQARLDQPADDIATTLMHAEVDGERLSIVEFASFFILLVVAGNETTRTAISHGMLQLSRNPDQRQLLLDDYATHAIDAVEEIVRWATPVIHFRRTATCDTEISGHPIAEGEKVVMWFNSANRDERAFTDPSRFDVTRSPNQHVGYGGGGPHFCLGANLARREISVMFEELFRRLPDIEISGEPDMLQSSFIHGIKRMPCTFTPA
ncbi:MAG TPA: cytochrome P450 [Acidimicrobiia bacterium]|nr:cytochrome P450 [Acidimicrobiia bacterium]